MAQEKPIEETIFSPEQPGQEQFDAGQSAETAQETPETQRSFETDEHIRKAAENQEAGRHPVESPVEDTAAQETPLPIPPLETAGETGTETAADDWIKNQVVNTDGVKPGEAAELLDTLLKKTQETK